MALFGKNKKSGPESGNAKSSPDTRRDWRATQRARREALFLLHPFRSLDKPVSKKEEAELDTAEKAFKQRTGAGLSTDDEEADRQFVAFARAHKVEGKRVLARLGEDRRLNDHAINRRSEEIGEALSRGGLFAAPKAEGAAVEERIVTPQDGLAGRSDDVFEAPTEAPYPHALDPRLIPPNQKSPSTILPSWRPTARDTAWLGAWRPDMAIPEIQEALRRAFIEDSRKHGASDNLSRDWMVFIHSMQPRIAPDGAVSFTYLPPAQQEAYALAWALQAAGGDAARAATLSLPFLWNSGGARAPKNAATAGVQPSRAPSPSEEKPSTETQPTPGPNDGIEPLHGAEYDRALVRAFEHYGTAALRRRQELDGTDAVSTDAKIAEDLAISAAIGAEIGKRLDAEGPDSPLSKALEERGVDLLSFEEWRSATLAEHGAPSLDLDLPRTVGELIHKGAWADDGPETAGAGNGGGGRMGPPSDRTGGSEDGDADEREPETDRNNDLHRQTDANGGGGGRGPGDPDGRHPDGDDDEPDERKKKEKGRRKAEGAEAADRTERSSGRGGSASNGQNPNTEEGEGSAPGAFAEEERARAAQPGVLGRLRLDPTDRDGIVEAWMGVRAQAAEDYLSAMSEAAGRVATPTEPYTREDLQAAKAHPRWKDYLQSRQDRDELALMIDLDRGSYAEALRGAGIPGDARHGWPELDKDAAPGRARIDAAERREQEEAARARREADIRARAWGDGIEDLSTEAIAKMREQEEAQREARIERYGDRAMQDAMLASWGLANGYLAQVKPILAIDAANKSESKVWRLGGLAPNIGSHTDINDHENPVSKNRDDINDFERSKYAVAYALCEDETYLATLPRDERAALMKDASTFSEWFDGEIEKASQISDPHERRVHLETAAGSCMASGAMGALLGKVSEAAQARVAYEYALAQEFSERAKNDAQYGRGGLSSEAMAAAMAARQGSRMRAGADFAKTFASNDLLNAFAESKGDPNAETVREAATAYLAGAVQNGAKTMRGMNGATLATLASEGAARYARESEQAAARLSAGPEIDPDKVVAAQKERERKATESDRKAQGKTGANEAPATEEEAQKEKERGEALKKEQEKYPWGKPLFADTQFAIGGVFSGFTFGKDAGPSLFDALVRGGMKGREPSQDLIKEGTDLASLSRNLLDARMHEGIYRFFANAHHQGKTETGEILGELVRMTMVDGSRHLAEARAFAKTDVDATMKNDPEFLVAKYGANLDPRDKRFAEMLHIDRPRPSRAAMAAWLLTNDPDGARPTVPSAEAVAALREFSASKGASPQSVGMDGIGSHLRSGPAGKDGLLSENAWATLSPDQIRQAIALGEKHGVGKEVAKTLAALQSGWTAAAAEDDPNKTVKLVPSSIVEARANSVMGKLGKMYESDKVGANLVERMTKNPEGFVLSEDGRNALGIDNGLWSEAMANHAQGWLRKCGGIFGLGKGAEERAGAALLVGTAVAVVGEMEYRSSVEQIKGEEADKFVASRLADEKVSNPASRTVTQEDLRSAGCVADVVIEQRGAELANGGRTDRLDVADSVEQTIRTSIFGGAKDDLGPVSPDGGIGGVGPSGPSPEGPSTGRGGRGL